MEDKQARCECGKEFTITIGEQTFYASKKLNPPKRCADCRKRRKAERIAKVAEDERVEAVKKQHETSPFHPSNWKDVRREKGDIDEFMERV